MARSGRRSRKSGRGRMAPLTQTEVAGPPPSLNTAESNSLPTKLQIPRPIPTASFDLCRLPAEIRAMVWHEALGPLPPPRDDTLAPIKSWSTVYRGRETVFSRATAVRIFSRQVPAPAKACHEARQLALSHPRYTKKFRSNNKRRWEVESDEYMIQYIDNKAVKSRDLLHLLDEHDTIVLALDTIYRPRQLRPALIAYLLDFILAAKDFQIKLAAKHEIPVRTTIDKLTQGNPFADWRALSRLVSLYDIGTIQDLARLQRNVPWQSGYQGSDLIGNLALSTSAREAMIETEIGPIQKAWEAAVQKRTEGAKVKLPSLPKIDVLVRVRVDISTPPMHPTYRRGGFSTAQWNQMLRDQGFEPS